MKKHPTQPVVSVKTGRKQPEAPRSERSNPRSAAPLRRKKPPTGKNGFTSPQEIPIGLKSNNIVMAMIQLEGPLPNGKTIVA